MRVTWLAVLSALFAAVLVGPVSAQSDAPIPAASDVQGDYRLGVGDKVRILTFGEASLTGDFVVSGTGVVALPLVGDVKATGLTVTQFQEKVEATLRDGYLRDPKVSIEVLNYRPFYILGEVTKPGEYPYSNGLTVMNAVATANGFTYRADKRHVYIRRALDKAEKRYDLTSQSAVAPGDTIRIAERLF